MLMYLSLMQRLRGITKSISRYPTFRRRFDNLVKTISEELAKKNGGSSSSSRRTYPRSASAFGRLFSQKSYNNSQISKQGAEPADIESQSVNNRDVEPVNNRDVEIRGWNMVFLFSPLFFWLSPLLFPFQVYTTYKHCLFYF